MTETIRVDDWFYVWVESQKDDGETTSDALIRLTGAPGPHPDDVSGIISPEDGDRMQERIDDLDRSDPSLRR